MTPSGHRIAPGPARVCTSPLMAPATKILGLALLALAWEASPVSGEWTDGVSACDPAARGAACRPMAPAAASSSPLVSPWSPSDRNEPHYADDRLAPPCPSSPILQRATFYGTDAWSIHKGSCGFGYQYAGTYNEGVGFTLSESLPASL